MIEKREQAIDELLKKSVHFHKYAVNGQEPVCFFEKGGGGILNELKVYAETGEVSEAKKARMKELEGKKAKKAA